VRRVDEFYSAEERVHRTCICNGFKVRPPLVNFELRLSLTDGVSSCSSDSGVCLLRLMQSEVTNENLELLTRV